MIIVDTHPINTNIKLYFNSDKHSYTDVSDNKYLSVTSFISSFFPKFDSEKVAERCAIKRGVSKESLLQEWRELGSSAAKLGNTVHSYFNNLLKEGCESPKLKLIGISDLYRQEVNRIYDSITSKGLTLVFSEKIIFSPSLKIAGICDALFLNKEKTAYVLMDWKTCKEIVIENKWNSFALKPIEHLSDCNFNHYSLQLELYKYLLRKESYVDTSLPIICKLIQIVPENKSKSFTTVNVEKEIQSLIEDRT